MGNTNTKKNSKVKRSSNLSSYHKFDKIDGSHPFKKILPEGYIDYPARIRPGGKVSYFNFELAREMGLISADHDDHLTKDLNNKLLETFGLIIVNEYDQMNGRVYPEEEMKSGKYMATRYLQLQHPDNTGKNSGDGRSVWNGQIKHRGKVWDISSCGTGATRLSPATSKFNKFFENGDPSISYGCGYAEIDEGLATALFSDIFHQNKIGTEQTLCLIDYGDKYSIHVRVHQNLLRPSHFFLYLKQNDWDSLKKLTDYFIQHQEKYGDLQISSKKNQYQDLLKWFTKKFAMTAALFEDEYIFCWLDWDGDNILMDGSIIDYGSIRQFGLFHSEYRYDDDDRYSTSIVEQKQKAKYLVQTFAQMIDFLETKNKKSIKKFFKHWALKEFDRSFEDCKSRNLLYKMGLDQRFHDKLVNKHPRKINSFKKVFSYFERAKSSRGLVEVSDGITWDAIFCMRDLLRELPQIYSCQNKNISAEEFIEIIRSNYATDDDVKILPYRKRKITEFQKKYKDIIQLASKEFDVSTSALYLEMMMRSSVINKYERVTGDAVTVIVDQIMKKRKTMKPEKLYKVVKWLSIFQNFDPKELNHQQPIEKQGRLLKSFYDIIKEYREGL